MVHTFIKFWIKDQIFCQNLYLKDVTVVYGKSAIPILPKVKKLECYQTHFKNLEFTWKPFTESLEKLVMLDNDLYNQTTQNSFDFLQCVVFYRQRFINLRHLEFDGQGSEESFIHMFSLIQQFKQLSYIRILNRNVFFNMEGVMRNFEIKTNKIFEKSKIIRHEQNRRQVNSKFTLPGEKLERHLEFWYNSAKR